jgi:hypothetical protein
MSRVGVGPGWQVLTGPPGGRLTQVAGPALALSPTLVVRTRYWRVPGSEPDVLADLTTHPPAGLAGAGTSSDRGSGMVPLDQLTLAPIHPSAAEFPEHRLAGESLAETVIADPEGGTDLRVDARVSWLPPRLPAQTIPPRATGVVITVTSPATGRRRLAQVAVADPTVATRLRSEVNGMIPALPFSTSGGLCISDADPVWRVAFGVPRGRTWTVITTRTATGDRSVVARDSKRVGPALDTDSTDAEDVTSTAFTDELHVLTAVPLNNC